MPLRSAGPGFWVGSGAGFGQGWRHEHGWRITEALGGESTGL
jgi:hypothetical protein